MNHARMTALVTLMLYAGPVIAGLSGYGWLVVPAFIIVFLASRFILNPGDWPRDAGAVRDGGAMAAVALQVVIVAVVVLVCFGVGRGIGGVFGYLPQVSLAVPLLLSVASIPLARRLQRPGLIAQTDTRLGTFDRDAAFPSADAQHILDGTQLALRLLQTVQDLPRDTAHYVIAQHLNAMATQVDDARLREALVERAEGDAPSRPLLTALAVHSTDARRMGALGHETVDPAFAALGDDAAVVALYADRAVAAVTADVSLRLALPRPALVERALSRMAGTEAEAPLKGLLAQSRLRVEPTL